MDRFIDSKAATMYIWQLFKIQYGQIYRNTAEYQLMFAMYLKSNMDRFIGTAQNQENYRDNYLKSNMDRFIALPHIQRKSLTKI